MIPKHGLACVLLLLTFSTSLQANASMVSGDDTTIGAMERKMFAHSYPGESEISRLSRLEKIVFGAVDATNSVNVRFSRLSACLSVKATSTNRTISSTLPLSSAACTKQADPANISSYPRVTQLELRLLGKSYFGEPIARRLSRLELKEFGSASTSNDLAGRMDALSAIATSNVERTRVNELASYQTPSIAIDNYREHMYRLFQDSTFAQRKEQPTTIVDQIEYLESAAFGKIHHNKPLQKRVGALEEKYYGASKVDDANLTLRVAQLLSLVNNGNAKAVVAHS